MAKPTNGIAKTRRNTGLIRILGWLIVAAALVYVGGRLAANYTSLSTLHITHGGLAILAACAIAYGAALVPLAVTWGYLANLGSNTRPPAWQALSIYGRSQFAKYLPGNVFHYAGRQVLGQGFGWSQSGMVLGSILEIVLVAAAAASMVLAYGAFAEGALFSLIPKTALAIGLMACLAAPWALFLGAPHVPLLGRLLPKYDAVRFLRSPLLPAAFLVYVIYFAASGVIAWLALGTIGISIDAALFPTIAAGFIASWLIGYITPGASGGIGVREAAFALLLGGTLGEPTALALALALRFATTFGDLLNFVASLLIHRMFNRTRETRI